MEIGVITNDWKKKYAKWTNPFICIGARDGKIFIAKAIFQPLVCMYNNKMDNGPLQLEGLVPTYTWKTMFNARDVAFNFTLYMSFNKTKSLSLNNVNTIYISEALSTISCSFYWWSIPYRCNIFVSNQ